MKSLTIHRPWGRNSSSNKRVENQCKPARRKAAAALHRREPVDGGSGDSEQLKSDKGEWVVGYRVEE